MSGKLSGRRVIITGGASGMGRAIARLFAQEGAALALLDRDAEASSRLAAELGASSCHCDVADRSLTGKAVEAGATAMGGVDAVVNAAGILEIMPFAELAPESFDRMIAVNLTGPFNVVRAALPWLQQAPSATVVNIASVSGLMPMPGTSGYSASKGGLIMLTRSMAMDLGPNIRVNAICPGVVKTEMTRYIWENEEHSARASERVALKRLGEAEDIARAALFLSSDDSAFSTGVALTADGGFSWH